MLLVTLYCLTITYNRQVLRINHGEIMCKNIMYLPHRGCVRTLRTLYVYATVRVRKNQSFGNNSGKPQPVWTKLCTRTQINNVQEISAVIGPVETKWGGGLGHLPCSRLFVTKTRHFPTAYLHRIWLPHVNPCTLETCLNGFSINQSLFVETAQNFSKIFRLRVTCP